MGGNNCQPISAEPFTIGKEESLEFRKGMTKES